VGLEALSRGAETAVFVERAPAALKVLRSNLEKLGLREGFRVEPGSAAGYLKKVRTRTERGFDLVFLDPPYDAAEEYATVLGTLGGDTGVSTGAGILAIGALVIAEHRRHERLSQRYGSLARMRLLEQGDASLSFYAVNELPAAE
jgi:16S rRNA G966 N2-methylase RsmD